RPEVLFVGLEGRGRSQIAASLANLRSQGQITAHAAGTDARLEHDDNVMAAMREVGIDLADEYSMPLTDEALPGADGIGTMRRSGGPVQIPASSRHEDWRIGDPVGADLDEVRRIRDDVDARVQALIAGLTAEEAEPKATETAQP